MIHIEGSISLETEAHDVAGDSDRHETMALPLFFLPLALCT